MNDIQNFIDGVVVNVKKTIILKDKQEKNKRQQKTHRMKPVSFF
ncbi:MAG: hypothetical protein ACI4RJ_00555 [Alphaproteobacteria bacterium]